MALMSTRESKSPTSGMCKFSKDGTRQAAEGIFNGNALGKIGVDSIVLFIGRPLGQGSHDMLDIVSWKAQAKKSAHISRLDEKGIIHTHTRVLHNCRWRTGPQTDKQRGE